MWKFLSATLELPSDWGNWTFSQRKQWEDFYREDPTPLLTEEQNEAYILVLRKIYLELDKSSYKTNEEWQDYWDEICRRLTMAGDDFYS